MKKKDMTVTSDDIIVEKVVTKKIIKKKDAIPTDEITDGIEEIKI